MGSAFGRRSMLQLAPALGLLLLSRGARAQTGFPSARLTDVLPQLLPGHPRLLMTDSTLESCRRKAAADPVYARVIARIIQEADKMLDERPVRYKLTGAERPSMLGGSRQIIRIIANSAFAWRWTRDARYADRAKVEILNAARFPEWNHTHFLDVAETAFGVALGYDWLRSELTADERALVRMALTQKCLLWADRAYRGTDDEWLGFPNYWWNWNPVCNGGVLAAAIAVAEDEPLLVRDILAGARKSLQKALDAFGPDGGGAEGPVYWSYGVLYYALCVAMLETAVGSDMGLTDSPGFAQTDLYRLWVQGPTGKAFNYGDCREELATEAALGWLGQRNGHPQTIAFARRALMDNLEKETLKGEFDRFFFMSALWYPEAQSTIPAMPPAAHFRGEADIACFRSDWASADAAYLGFKAGDNAANHSHLDLGSFVLEGQGVRWSTDLGRDAYQVPGYFDGATPQGRRYRIFRIGTASHSTFMPEGVQQDVKAIAPITAFSAYRDGGHAIADLTAAYPGHAASIRRGVRMTGKGRRVEIRDEVSGAKPTQRWRWAMVTQAEVALHGNRAILTLAGRTMEVVAEDPAARFEILPLTPPTTVENANEGYRMLALFVQPDADGTARCSVTLHPLGKASKRIATASLAAW